MYKGGLWREGERDPMRTDVRGLIAVFIVRSLVFFACDKDDKGKVE